MMEKKATDLRGRWRSTLLHNANPTSGSYTRVHIQDVVATVTYWLLDSCYEVINLCILTVAVWVDLTWSQWVMHAQVVKSCQSQCCIKEDLRLAIEALNWLVKNFFFWGDKSSGAFFPTDFQTIRLLQSEELLFEGHSGLRLGSLKDFSEVRKIKLYCDFGVAIDWNGSYPLNLIELDLKMCLKEKKKEIGEKERSFYPL